jgi:microcystin-dependent protein
MNIGSIKFRSVNTDFAIGSQQWLACDGRAINRLAYATLFGIIGISFGPGDGVNTFNIPDYRGILPVGASAGGYAVGTLVGSAIHHHTANLWGGLLHAGLAATAGPNEAAVQVNGGGGAQRPSTALHGHGMPTLDPHAPPAASDDETSYPPYLAIGILIRAL